MWSILYDVKKNDNSFADIFEFIKLCFEFLFQILRLKDSSTLWKSLKPIGEADWEQKI